MTVFISFTCASTPLAQSELFYTFKKKKKIGEIETSPKGHQVASRIPLLLALHLILRLLLLLWLGFMALLWWILLVRWLLSGWVIRHPVAGRSCTILRLNSNSRLLLLLLLLLLLVLGCCHGILCSTITTWSGGYKDRGSFTRHIATTAKPIPCAAIPVGIGCPWMAGTPG